MLRDSGTLRRGDGPGPLVSRALDFLEGAEEPLGLADGLDLRGEILGESLSRGLLTAK